MLTIKVTAEELASLRQFKEWAEPQVIQHGADTLLIAQLRELAKEVSSLDCFYTGYSCPADCQCLSARAGRLAFVPSAGLKP